MKIALALVTVALVGCVAYIIVGAGDRVLTFLLVGLSLAAGIVALRFSVSFDLNRYFEDQRKKRQRRAQSLCPHMDILSFGKDETGDIALEVQSTYTSPPGTVQWQCDMCGDVTHEQMVHANTRRWNQDPEALVERVNQFRKAAEKIDG